MEISQKNLICGQLEYLRIPWLLAIGHSHEIMLVRKLFQDTMCIICNCGDRKSILLIKQNIINSDYYLSIADLVDWMNKMKIQFVKSEWSKISLDAVKFIKLWMNSDPNLRPTASKALKHAWIISINYENIGIDNDINKTANETLKRFSTVAQRQNMSSFQLKSNSPAFFSKSKRSMFIHCR